MKSEMESALSNPGPLRMSDGRASILGEGADHTILRRERVNNQIGTPVIHLWSQQRTSLSEQSTIVTVCPGVNFVNSKEGKTPVKKKVPVSRSNATTVGDAS